LKRLCFAALLITLALGAASSDTIVSIEADALHAAAPAKLEFAEIWAYLMDGEERFLAPDQPVTDIGYFSAGIGIAGNLLGVPSRDGLSAFKGRVHLVVAELGNYSLTHFCLDPRYPLRDALIADIAKGAEAYDGVQIDFEAVSSKDFENFYAFLAQLKGVLGKKTLSVALSAQIKEASDNLSYDRIGKIADRIIVMAYDEHWSSSDPGPVASIDWCRKVALFALSKVDASKLVMGAPFYGRSWVDKNLARAYKYSSLVKLIDEKGFPVVRRQGEIPFMEYIESVNVKVFFDDYASTLARLGMYRGASIKNVAFWRLGQEDSGIWAAIETASLASPSPPAPLAEASKPPCEVP
jgi:hypothetical protein